MSGCKHIRIATVGSAGATTYECLRCGLNLDDASSPQGARVQPTAAVVEAKPVAEPEAIRTAKSASSQVAPELPITLDQKEMNARVRRVDPKTYRRAFNPGASGPLTIVSAIAMPAYILLSGATVQGSPLPLLLVSALIAAIFAIIWRVRATGSDVARSELSRIVGEVYPGVPFVLDRGEMTVVFREPHS